MGILCSRRKYDIEIPDIDEENHFNKDLGFSGYQKCPIYDSQGTSQYLPVSNSDDDALLYLDRAIHICRLPDRHNEVNVGVEREEKQTLQVLHPDIERERIYKSSTTSTDSAIDLKYESQDEFLPRTRKSEIDPVISLDYDVDIPSNAIQSGDISTHFTERFHDGYILQLPGSCETYPVSGDYVISSAYAAGTGVDSESDGESDREIFDRGELYKTPGNTDNDHDCLSALHSAALKLKESYPQLEQIWEAVNCSSTNKELVLCVYNENNDMIKENSIDGFRIVSNALLKNEEENISEAINKTYQSIKFKSENICTIKETIKEHSQALFECHVNLSAISACAFKIEGGKIIQKWCIVLYCCFKGYIPLGEKKFPSSLKGIPVDVREGVFSFTGAHKSNENLLASDDMNPLMAIGKEITIDKSGLSATAGTFITFQLNGATVKGILTCAHVAFCKEELVQKECLPCQNLHVIDKHTRACLGEVCEGIFRPSQPVGIDAALVRIDDCFLPEYGQFVRDRNNLLKEIGFSEKTPPCFCNAEEVQKDDSGNYKTTSVFKFGASSGLSVGDINFDAAVCRISKLGFSSNDEDPVILGGQMHIFPRSSPDFFTQGDSGAIVFQNDGTKIGAVGLAIGNIDTACVVTDIRSILNAFKHVDMKLLKFQCEVDSGIDMSEPSNSTFPESLLSKFSSIDICSESGPPRRKRKARKSTDHEPTPSNTITVQTRSGLSIEAKNSQLKWQRGREYFTLTSPVPHSGSVLSIKTPDATSIDTIHNGEFELKTETEILRVIQCN